MSDMAAARPPVTLSDLDHDCLDNIFARLSLRDVNALALVNYALCVAVDQAPVWRNMVAPYYGLGTQPHEHKRDGIPECFAARRSRAGMSERQIYAAIEGLSLDEMAAGCSDTQHYNRRAAPLPLPWVGRSWVAAASTRAGQASVVGARMSCRWLVAYRGCYSRSNEMHLTAEEAKVLRHLTRKRRRTIEDLNYFGFAVPRVKRVRMEERVALAD